MLPATPINVRVLQVSCTMFKAKTMNMVFVQKEALNGITDTFHNNSEVALEASLYPPMKRRQLKNLKISNNIAVGNKTTWLSLRSLCIAAAPDDVVHFIDHDWSNVIFI